MVHKKTWRNLTWLRVYDNWTNVITLACEMCQLFTCVILLVSKLYDWKQPAVMMHRNLNFRQCHSNCCSRLSCQSPFLSFVTLTHRTIHHAALALSPCSAAGTDIVLFGCKWYAYQITGEFSGEPHLRACHQCKVDLISCSENYTSCSWECSRQVIAEKNF